MNREASSGIVRLFPPVPRAAWGIHPFPGPQSGVMRPALSVIRGLIRYSFHWVGTLRRSLQLALHAFQNSQVNTEGARRVRDALEEGDRAGKVVSKYILVKKYAKRRIS